MAIDTFKIDLTVANRVRQSFCKAHGYQDLINGAPNPEGRMQFMKRKLEEYVIESVKAAEATADAETAKAAAIAKVGTEVGAV